MQMLSSVNFVRLNSNFVIQVIYVTVVLNTYNQVRQDSYLICLYLWHQSSAPCGHLRIVTVKVLVIIANSEK